MKVEILEYPDSEKIYRDFNRRQYRMLAQHSWGWQKVLATFGNWQWRAIGLIDNSDNMIGCIPFCECENEIGKAIMSSPLPVSYAGVLHTKNCDKELVYSKLIKTLVNYCKDSQADIISIFTSPFRADTDYYQKYLKPDFSIQNFYQYIPAVPELVNQTNSKFRNNLKRNLRIAKENDLKIHYTGKPDKQQIKEWYNSVLSTRLKDIGGKSAPESFYQSVIENLEPEGMAEFAYVTRQNQMIAGGLFLYGWCQDIFLRATQTNSMKTGAGILLDYEMIKKGVKLKVKAHNFQSSTSRDSTNYIYKKQWGCVEDSTFYFVKVLTDYNKFITAGKKAVSKAFPHFFVLPYSIYEEN